MCIYKKYLKKKPLWFWQGTVGKERIEERKEWDINLTKQRRYEILQEIRFNL